MKQPDPSFSQDSDFMNQQYASLFVQGGSFSLSFLPSSLYDHQSELLCGMSLKCKAPDDEAFSSQRKQECRPVLGDGEEVLTVNISRRSSTSW